MLRLHCPEVIKKAKDVVNCRYTVQPHQETIETIFRIIVSAKQLSLYGAVAEMCEEYESLHDRSGRPYMVMGQSIVLRCDQDRSFLWRMRIQHIKTFYYNNMKNELRGFHNKID